MTGMERKKKILQQQAAQEDKPGGVESTFRAPTETQQPMRRITVILPAAIHRQLKLRAVEEDSSITALVIEAIDKGLNIRAD